MTRNVEFGAARASVSALILHEARLAWRDTLWLLTARNRWQAVPVLAIAFVIFAGMHGLAWMVLAGDQFIGADKHQSFIVGATAVLAASFLMMLSQSLESVTRLFYARGDLDLIMASPMPPERIFAPRLLTVAIGCWLTALPVAAPFIHVMAFYYGIGWLLSYLILLSFALLASNFSVWIACALFALLGPARTRKAAQILAAIIGAIFLIGLQLTAIFQTESFSRIEFVARHVSEIFPADPSSMIWWPGSAAAGNVVFVLGFLLLAAIAFAFTTLCLSKRFAWLTLAAQGMDMPPGLQRLDRTGQNTASVALGMDAENALRRKEWMLLVRDPWLISQSLMQILYLLPPAALLFLHYGGGEDTGLALAMAVLIMAMGQLAGGLAWLAISGEDAPDLIASSPIKPSLVVQTKIVAVLLPIAFACTPILVFFFLLAPLIALWAAAGVFVAAMSAVIIQIWCRGQASRRQFRRRQTTSRLAALSEALVCIGWAAAFSIASSAFFLGAVTSLFPLSVLFAVRTISRSEQALVFH